MMRIKAYSKEIEAQMLKVHKSLSEKDRRHYAAIEATKLGYGGGTYISRLLSRKSTITTKLGIGEAFLEVIDNSTAGSPMDGDIKWTNLSRANIALGLAKKDFKVSVTVIDQLLKKYNFRPRKAFKSEAGKENIPNRDEQFQNINKLRDEYTEMGDPVISMDVKKRDDWKSLS